MSLIDKILLKLKRKKDKSWALDYDRVLKFASKKHKGQFRKDGVTPYINHPIRVAKIVEKFVTEYGRQEDKDVLPELVAAALLHDTVEDSKISYRQELTDCFGELVAGLVMEVTTIDHEKNEKGKDRYLAERMSIMSEYALVIKFSDRLDNVSDCSILNLEDKFKLRRGTENILKYVEDKRWYYFSEIHKALLDALWEALNENIPYKIFEGTEFESLVFDNISYHNPNYT